MRSLLFVPADSPRKLARGLRSEADVLLLDLEDSVAAAGKAKARAMAADFLAAHAERGAGPRLFVRINGFATGLAETDLDAIVPARPDGILLPKAEGGADIQRLSAMLAAREAIAGIDDGATAILALTTETPAALFTLGTYGGASARLAGLTWGAEDLSTALAAAAYRDTDGHLTDPYRLARSLCLFGAAAAGVAPLDAVYVHFRDLTGLKAEAEAACRDGFTGKLAVHPDQVPVINRAFTPSAEALAEARALLAAFAEAGNPGVITIGDEMFDEPHRRRAELTIARAKAAGVV